MKYFYLTCLLLNSSCPKSPHPLRLKLTATSSMVSFLTPPVRVEQSPCVLLTPFIEQICKKACPEPSTVEGLLGYFLVLVPLQGVHSPRLLNNMSFLVYRHACPQSPKSIPGFECTFDQDPFL